MDPVYLNWRILAGAAPWLTMKQEHVRTATGTNECPAYMEALKAKGLSNKSTRAKSAIQATGLDQAQRFRGSLAERLLFSDSPPVVSLPPQPQLATLGSRLATLGIELGTRGPRVATRCSQVATCGFNFCG
ncbi:hypothetical protein ACLKA6_000661 [Drosophila palustris]